MRWAKLFMALDMDMGLMTIEWGEGDDRYA